MSFIQKARGARGGRGARPRLPAGRGAVAPYFHVGEPEEQNQTAEYQPPRQGRSLQTVNRQMANMNKQLSDQSLAIAALMRHSGTTVVPIWRTDFHRYGDGVGQLHGAASVRRHYG